MSSHELVAEARRRLAEIEREVQVLETWRERLAQLDGAQLRSTIRGQREGLCQDGARLLDAPALQKRHCLPAQREREELPAASRPGGARTTDAGPAPKIQRAATRRPVASSASSHAGQKSFARRTTRYSARTPPA